MGSPLSPQTTWTLNNLPSLGLLIMIRKKYVLKKVDFTG